MADIYDGLAEALKQGLGDDEPQTWGASNDVSQGWDGTNNVFELLPVADDTGVRTIGDGTTDMDWKWFGGTTAKYVLMDVGKALLQLEDVDLKLGDNDEVQFGDASGGDVSIVWEGNSLDIEPAADDTGAIEIGNGTADIDVKIFLGTTDEYVEFNVGDSDLNITVPIDVDISMGAISGEKHGYDMAVTATLSSGDSLVGNNIAVTTAGTAGTWVSGLFAKVTQGSTKNVNGYLCAAEFEVVNTAASSSDNAVIVLNSNSVLTGSVPVVPYILLREYGGATSPADAFIRIYGDTGQTASTDATALWSTVSQARTHTHSLRIVVGSTAYYIMCTDTGS